MSNGKGTKATFACRHFDREVILLCVRWYLRYKLSLRDLVERMAERGRAPIRITLDGCAASHRAVREMSRENEVLKHTKMRTSKYLNNLVEQNHRGIKSRTGPMLGFTRFDYAAIVIAGVELLSRIHKSQFALSHLRLRDQAVPAIWNAVLSA